MTYKVPRECHSVDSCLDDQKLVRNRKDHRFIWSKTRDRMSLNRGHVTATYKVTRDCHGIGLYLDDLVAQKKVLNLLKIIDLACTHPGRGWVGSDI